MPASHAAASDHATATDTVCGDVQDGGDSLGSGRGLPRDRAVPPEVKPARVKPSQGVQPSAALLQAMAACADDDADGGRRGKVHLWHGGEVVRVALEVGGEEALHDIAAR